MATTFIMIKPDAFERHLVATLIQEIKNAGFRIIDQKKYIVDETTILTHYEEVIKKVPNPHFKQYILDAFVGKEVLCLKLESDLSTTVKDFRVLLGKTNPVEADRNSLRGKYGNDSYEKSGQEQRMLNNLIHASDSDENAHKELKLWFNSSETLK